MAKYKVKDQYKGTKVSFKGSSAYYDVEDLTDKQIEELIDGGLGEYFTKVKKAKQEDKS